MSDPEQLIRDTWRRWNEGLREADPEVMDPEIEIHSELAHRVFRGYDEMPKWSREIDEQFESWSIDVSDVRVLTPEKVVVVGEIHARGRQSGLDIDQSASWVVELRDGRILRIRNFIGGDAAGAAIAFTDQEDPPSA